MLRLAFAQVRERPASFVAAAATGLPPATTITLFASILADRVAVLEDGAVIDDRAA